MKTLVIARGIAIGMICGAIVLGIMQYKKQRDIDIKLYGPNPAVFKFETNLSHGTITVRDADHAEDEIIANEKQTWEYLKHSEHFKVEGEVPEIKVVKLERIK